MAELNGEVKDYNPKEILMRDAIKDDTGYVVLRVHRDGSTTVLSETRIVAADAEAGGES